MTTFIRNQFFLYFFVLALVGCTSIGPHLMQMDRQNYSNAVRQTDQEQLLSNIVRARYLELTQFVQIASLTSSYSLSETLGADISAPVHPFPKNVNPSLSPSVTYSDSPTISYIPLSNTDFAKSMMTPVTMLDSILLAHAGGYDYIVLLQLLFERLNDADSNVINRGGVNHVTTQFLKFNQILEAINYLSRHKQFELPRSVMFEKRLGLMLRIKKQYQNSREALKLKKLLDLPAQGGDIIFIERSLDEQLLVKNGILVLAPQHQIAHNMINVRFRSLSSIIHFLGYGVQIPRKDINAHMTREVVNVDGTRHDWTQQMKNIMTIYSSEKKPRQDVLVKVFIHDYWFYIKASDQASKDTLDATTRLLTLTSVVATPAYSGAPVLTISVRPNNVAPTSSSGK